LIVVHVVKIPFYGPGRFYTFRTILAIKPSESVELGPHLQVGISVNIRSFLITKENEKGILIEEDICKVSKSKYQIIMDCKRCLFKDLIEH
jgi:hypothetical protein